MKDYNSPFVLVFIGLQNALAYRILTLPEKGIEKSYQQTVININRNATAVGLNNKRNKDKETKYLLNTSMALLRAYFKNYVGLEYT